METEPEKDGKIILRHANGAKRAEGTKINGRAHGPWTFWYEDGSVMQVGSYIDDMPHGRWIYYWKNHNKQREGSYEHGRRAGCWIGWHANGTMSECGEYSDDHEDGFWQYWDENGLITSEGNYVKGNRHGSWRFQGINPGRTFITEWFEDQLTNVSGMLPRQAAGHRGFYYPVVPGQLPCQVTPFDNPGASSGVYFGCVAPVSGVENGAGPFTYMFKPAAPMNDTEAAGLFFAIWLRYSYLHIMEKLYTAFPSALIPDTLPQPVCKPQQYVIISDPLSTGIRDKQYRVCNDSLDEAITIAQMVADEWGYKTVVAAQIYEYPLDI